MTKFEIIKQKIFWSYSEGDFETTFGKSLWRLSQGNKEKAYNTIRETVKHYTDLAYTDFDLDCILGELNGGIEVEWLS